MNKTLIASLVKVAIADGWSDKDVSHYTFGSVEGARKFVEKNVARGGVYWYSIEINDYYPCHGEDESGQLFIGWTPVEFKELKERSEDDVDS